MVYIAHTLFVLKVLMDYYMTHCTTEPCFMLQLVKYPMLLPHYVLRETLQNWWCAGQPGLSPILTLSFSLLETTTLLVTVLWPDDALLQNYFCQVLEAEHLPFTGIMHSNIACDNCFPWCVYWCMQPNSEINLPQDAVDGCCCCHLVDVYSLNWV
jgi:hypothetical protein